jgi:hypothetical protein
MSALCKYCGQSIEWRKIKGRYVPHQDGKPHRHQKSEGVFLKEEAERVDPDSLAAYSHWNEDAERVYYAEHPEIFGRG